MIADTTFVSDLLREREREIRGPASAFLARRRAHAIRLSIITAAEIAVLFPDSAAAWQWLKNWRIYRLNDGVVNAAANIDRALIRTGARLGENDNWIAGFAAFYSEPLISRDEAFDRVPGIRRLEY